MVSVVIRCCNEEQHIGRLLDGILRQTVKDLEVIVVDSGSTDGTLDIVSRYPVRVVPISPEAFSFGRALNLGCSAARGEFIIIASAHVYPVYVTWIESLLVPFLDLQVALVYGKQRGNEVTQYSEHQILAHWFREQSNPNQTYPFCNNANAAIRRAVWNQMAYDEKLTGLEDLDWAKRAMQAGHKIAYSAEAEIVHVHNESPLQIYNRYRREAIAMKHIFSQEHFHLWDFLRLFVMNTLNDYYHSFRDHVLTRNWLSIARFRLMQFWGTYRGFSHKGIISGQLIQAFYYPRGFKRHSPLGEMKKEQAIVYGQTE